jgi:hypothetical protein
MSKSSLIFLFSKDYFGLSSITFFGIFFGGLECVGHSFVYVADFLFLRDWMRTQRAAEASRLATNFVTHLLKPGGYKVMTSVLADQ